MWTIYPGVNCQSDSTRNEYSNSEFQNQIYFEQVIKFSDKMCQSMSMLREKGCLQRTDKQNKLQLLNKCLFCVCVNIHTFLGMSIYAYLYKEYATCDWTWLSV